MMMVEPVWQAKPAAPKAVPEYEHHLVVLGAMEEESVAVIETEMGVRCINLQTKSKGFDKRFQGCAVQLFEAIQKLMLEKQIGKVLVQLVVVNQAEQGVFAGLSGLLKTAQLENPKLTGQLIEVAAGEDTAGLIAKLKENRLSLDSHIRYQSGEREVAGWQETELSQAAGSPWRSGGIYLITGGAGGLGLIFAQEIMNQVKDGTLILTGRSKLQESKQAKLESIVSQGNRISYRQVDVTDKKAVVSLIQSILAEFGGLHGIIHSAGVICDSYIIRKTTAELQTVLAPKVNGLVNLDEASKDVALDFIILFSSIAGSLGNPGQADYAMANAFMDAYARYRNTMVSSGYRYGQTLSINWPLWKEGGMQIDEAIQR